MFLVVEDDHVVLRTYMRALERHGGVVSAEGIAAARATIAMVDQLVGAVLDVSLPDGSGIDLARELRGRWRDVPILLVSGAVDSRRLDGAHELEAAYLVKPVNARQLSRFAERAIERLRRETGLLDAWAERYGLTPAEIATLRLALDGLRRDEIAARRGVKPGTAKMQIHSILSRTGSGSLDELVASYYRELAGHRPPGDK